MENYKPPIYGLLGGAAALIAYAQTQRNPEEIMREEKPAIDSFITARETHDILSLIHSKAHEAGFSVYKAENNNIILAS